ncbi:unnamed protein product [Camellia sinensis]
MSSTSITLVDLLLFYTLERVLFNRIVNQLGKNPNLVKKAMALWLMLEEIGYYDLTRTIHSLNNHTIEAVFDEALSCLDCIQPGAEEPVESDNDTSVFFRLIFDEPMNRRFFYYNREFMHRRFVHIMVTVCGKIFGEREAVEIDESSGRLVARGGGGGEVARQSRLNPNASEFVPGQSHEDTSTMFLTFSKGFALTPQEIFNFFTLKWGDVVQNVVVEQPVGGQAPLYGRVIFKWPMTIPLVLNGQPKAKFIVGRKHLWARIYKPRRR